MAILVSTKLAGEICDALGLKNVTKLTLQFAVGHVATARATMFVEKDGVMQLPTIVKRYRLIEKPRDAD